MNPKDHIKNHMMPVTQDNRFGSESVSGALLIVGLASTLVVWGGPTFWPLMFSMLGIFLLARERRRWPGSTGGEAQSTLNALCLAFAAYATCSAAIFLIHGNRFNVEAILPFLLFPFLAVGVSHLKLKPRYFWWGAAWGGHAALALAAQQHYLEGMQRAQGFMHPIAFGDISVVFALAATIGVSSSHLRQHESPALIWALGTAALAASFASLLSGSRGGWLSLATVMALGAVRFIATQSKQRRWLASLALFGLLMGGLHSAPSHVFERLETGLKGGVAWLQTGEITDGSVSYRLEMWSLGMRLFREHPLLGADRQTWLEKKEAYIQAGEFPPDLRSQETMDSEWVGALAGGGVLGLANSLMLIVVPAWAFRRAKQRGGAASQDLALLGVWIPILFFEFGLSISLWGVSAFRQVYVSWLVLLAALIINVQHLANDARGNSS